MSKEVLSEGEATPVTEVISAVELTREKSLWALYKLSYKFPRNAFNVRSVSLAAVLLVVFAGASIRDVGQLASTTRAIFNFGATLAPAILGFLIAGFTIFVTVTKIEIFTHMAVKPYKQTGESYLKYNLSAFVLAFAHYLAYLFCCVFIVLFGQPQSVAILLLKKSLAAFFICEVPLYNFLVGIVLVLFGTWTVYLVLLLKSFVYNTYQVVTTTVRWELLDADKKRKQKSGVESGEPPHS